MTIQLGTYKSHGTSKTVLQAALNEQPERVRFEDPSIFQGSRGTFYGNDIKNGEKFPIVMDPQTRRRFATIVRDLNTGAFRVR